MDVSYTCTSVSVDGVLTSVYLIGNSREDVSYILQHSISQVCDDLQHKKIRIAT